MITEVQTIAIESLIDMRGLKYNTLVQHALGKFVEMSDLTCNEAFEVIQSGNELYNTMKFFDVDPEEVEDFINGVHRIEGEFKNGHDQKR